MAVFLSESTPPLSKPRDVIALILKQLVADRSPLADAWLQPRKRIYTETTDWPETESAAELEFDLHFGRVAMQTSTVALTEDDTTEPRELDAGATRKAFRELFLDRTSRAEHLFKEIVSNSSPQTLLRITLDEFDSKGNQDRLDLCARLLIEMGRDAVPVLEAIVSSGFEEQSAFVDTIALSNCLSKEERRTYLCQLARSSLLDTRWRMLDVLGCLSEELQHEVLKILEQDPVPDIAEQARAERADLGLIP